MNSSSALLHMTGCLSAGAGGDWPATSDTEASLMAAPMAAVKLSQGEPPSRVNQCRITIAE